MPRSLFTLLSVCLGVLLSGCKQYEYVLVEPVESAQTFSMHQADIERSGLLYQFAVTGGQLRMRIVNNSNDPVRLQGDRSYLVDSRGESYSLPGRTIAAGSFASIYMPPRRPRGGGVGFGVGVGGGSDGTFGGVGVGTSDDYWDDTYADDPPYYDWEEGDLSLHLAYMGEAGSNDEMVHDFLLRRQEKLK